MDIKTGLLVFTLLGGCMALPSVKSPDNDMSIFFDHTDASHASVRIVGGNQAAVGSHPHMVALTTGDRVKSLVCGGSLITQRSILTAAHCINFLFTDGSLTSSLRAIVGTNYWNRGGTTYRIQRNITHPHNDADSIKNDLGVLITSFKVALWNRVRTVPITYSFIGNGVRAIVAGWGRTSANAAASASLLELRLNTIGGYDCVDRVVRAAVELDSNLHVEPHIEICTMPSSRVGTCNGDSGSALRRADNGQQFGIVSWGFPCARGAPDMFVRISAYQNWLRSVIV